MKLIVGLGNPGLKYLGTRHNVGFDAVDYIAHHCDIKLNKEKFKAQLGGGKIGDEQVVFIKPQTFMNLSGESVAACMKFFKVEPEDIMVIYDDISFDAGVIKIKQTGSDGGHNGIKSVIDCIRTRNFPRIKIGVGKQPDYYNLADFVLGKFTDKEFLAIKNEMPYVKDIVYNYVTIDLSTAMNKYALRNK